MKYSLTILLIINAAIILSCNSNDETGIVGLNSEIDSFSLEYYGADLSYVNEMEDCGAEYFDKDGTKKDPYEMFKTYGCNLVRLRLWHNPAWFTEYSDYDDVKKAISRSKENNMDVLLDFHYSDDWADPGRQTIPAAWLPVINDTDILADSIYNYTYTTLKNLAAKNLLPEIVQIGNETNAMILQEDEELEWPIDWDRNSELLNHGIQAVRDISNEFNKEIGVMLHIAQPENGIWWFRDATQNGVTDFDWIGLSYYPLWSEYDLKDVDEPLKTLVETYDKKLMIVETAYPFTTINSDAAGNILGIDATVEGIPVSKEGQLEFLLELEKKVSQAGAHGIVYWEPAWVSTGCSTQWGTGSHWDNATLFDQENKINPGIDFYLESLK